MRALGRRGAVAALLCAALLGAGATAASAATGDQSWTGQITTAKATSSSATAVWNGRTYYLSLRVTTGTLAAGRCVTAYFDWTSKGHHDARAVRDCQSATTVTYVFPDATPSNITGAANKVGICYAPQDKVGTCVRGHGTQDPRMNWTPWPDLTRTTPCDLSWVRRNTDGTTADYLDPDSQKSGTAAYNAC
jgi:hypothetical protein